MRFCRLGPNIYTMDYIDAFATSLVKMNSAVFMHTLLYKLELAFP